MGTTTSKTKIGLTNEMMFNAMQENNMGCDVVTDNNQSLCGGSVNIGIAQIQKSAVQISCTQKVSNSTNIREALSASLRNKASSDSQFLIPSTTNVDINEYINNVVNINITDDVIMDVNANISNTQTMDCNPKGGLNLGIVQLQTSEVYLDAVQKSLNKTGLYGSLFSDTGLQTVSSSELLSLGIFLVIGLVIIVALVMAAKTATDPNTGRNAQAVAPLVA